MASTKTFPVNARRKGAPKGTPKEQIGEVTVPVYDSVTEAINDFEAKDAGKGESTILGIINDSIRNSAIASKRLELSGKSSPLQILAKRQKAGELNAEQEAQVAALLKAFNMA